MGVEVGPPGRLPDLQCGEPMAPGIAGAVGSSAGGVTSYSPASLGCRQGGGEICGGAAMSMIKCFKCRVYKSRGQVFSFLRVIISLPAPEVLFRRVLGFPRQIPVPQSGLEQVSPVYKCMSPPVFHNRLPGLQGNQMEARLSDGLTARCFNTASGLVAVG